MPNRTVPAELIDEVKTWTDRVLVVDTLTGRVWGPFPQWADGFMWGRERFGLDGFSMELLLNPSEYTSVDPAHGTRSGATGS
jgi:hypothetical protein